MNLRELRASRGLQRKFIVARIGISGKHLNDIEAARVRLTDKVAEKLANFYGIDIDEIKRMYEEGKNGKQGCIKKAKRTVARNFAINT
jgi:transcriptional regulator with XRE-family HTH domain